MRRRLYWHERFFRPRRVWLAGLVLICALMLAGLIAGLLGRINAV